MYFVVGLKIKQQFEDTYLHCYQIIYGGNFILDNRDSYDSNDLL